MGRGRGWHGEKRRHATAAEKGWNGRRQGDSGPAGHAGDPDPRLTSPTPKVNDQDLDETVERWWDDSAGYYEEEGESPKAADSMAYEDLRTDSNALAEEAGVSEERYLASLKRVRHKEQRPQVDQIFGPD